MIGLKRLRASLLVVTAGATALALLPLLTAVWTARGGAHGAGRARGAEGVEGADRADRAALDALFASPALPASRDHHAWPDPPPGSGKLETVIGTVAVAEVGEGETAVVDFVVPRRAIVRGRVVADGRPVAGAMVEHRSFVAWAPCVFAWRHARGPATDPVITGVDGRFEQSLPYGGDLAFWAVAPDGSRSGETRVSLTSGTAFEVELVVPTRR